jgi:hypothetical protein
MVQEDIRSLIQRELPALVMNDPQIRDWVWHLLHDYAPSRSETESRFEQMLAELRALREESERKWEENQRRFEAMQAESERRWEENNRRFEAMREEFQAEMRAWREESERRWEENNRRLEAMREEFQAEMRAWREESERRWEENNRRLEAMQAESARKWEENNRRLEAMQAESERRWEENNRRLEAMQAESARKWEENNRRLEAMQAESERRWEENQKIIRELLERDDRLARRVEQTIGALGARWGIATEASFRNALKGILEDSFGVKVERVEYFDESGEVFGRPDQVELDVLIRNGQILVCEIKSSASRADIYAFDRKVRSYEKRTQRSVDRKILISPMVLSKDKELAQALGVEVFSDAEQVVL